MFGSFRDLFKDKNVKIENASEEYHLACAAILV